MLASSPGFRSSSLSRQFAIVFVTNSFWCWRTAGGVLHRDGAWQRGPDRDVTQDGSDHAASRSSLAQRQTLSEAEQAAHDGRGNRSQPADSNYMMMGPVYSHAPEQQHELDHVELEPTAAPWLMNSSALQPFLAGPREFPWSSAPGAHDEDCTPRIPHRDGVDDVHDVPDYRPSPGRFLSSAAASQEPPERLMQLETFSTAAPAASVTGGQLRPLSTKNTAVHVPRRNKGARFADSIPARTMAKVIRGSATMKRAGAARQAAREDAPEGGGADEVQRGATTMSMLTSGQGVDAALPADVRGDRDTTLPAPIFPSQGQQEQEQRARQHSHDAERLQPQAEIASEWPFLSACGFSASWFESGDAERASGGDVQHLDVDAGAPGMASQGSTATGDSLDYSQQSSSRRSSLASGTQEQHEDDVAADLLVGTGSERETTAPAAVARSGSHEREGEDGCSSGPRELLKLFDNKAEKQQEAKPVENDSGSPQRSRSPRPARVMTTPPQSPKFCRALSPLTPPRTPPMRDLLRASLEGDWTASQPLTPSTPPPWQLRRDRETTAIAAPRRSGASSSTSCTWMSLGGGQNSNKRDHELNSAKSSLMLRRQQQLGPRPKSGAIPFPSLLPLRADAGASPGPDIAMASFNTHEGGQPPSSPEVGGGPAQLEDPMQQDSGHSPAGARSSWPPQSPPPPAQGRSSGVSTEGARDGPGEPLPLQMGLGIRFTAGAEASSNLNANSGFFQEHVHRAPLSRTPDGTVVLPADVPSDAETPDVDSDQDQLKEIEADSSEEKE